MKVRSAEMSGNFLMLGIDDEGIGEARRFVYHFKPGEHEIKKSVRKRSLDANALMWHLCREIGNAIGETAVYVYRRAIREGNVCDYLEIDSDKVESFCERWAKNGKGWTVQIVDCYGEKTQLLAYYGSSVYSTGEMSDLIDRLLQDADALGIDCLTERERSLLQDV